MVPTFEAAFNSGDVEQVMALYEPDSVLVAQPGQTVAGPAAIREALFAFLSPRDQSKLTAKRVLQSGDPFSLL
jgi:uncharacterized protein (TIGR02246 family)